MALVALVFFLLVQVPTPNPRSAISGPLPATRVISFRTDASPEEIQAAGAELLESYGAFAVARGGEGSLALVKAQGRYANPLEGSSTLQLLGGIVDLATLAPRPASEWPIDSRGETVGVVHFHAPIKAEWKDALQALGLHVLRYLPQDAFVVRGHSTAFDRGSILPYVDWLGPYAPSWKVRPDIPTGSLLDVRILVFPGESPETVEAWLGHQGIPPALPSASGPGVIGTFGGGDFRWVRAQIPSTLMSSLAALPIIEFIDPVYAVHDWNAETDWVIQSNSTGNYRYWSAGLDGTGQVVGMADTGLDYDGNSFRQSSGSIVSGDIYNTTDPSRRKVIRYVNMGVQTGQLTWLGGGGQWDPWSIKDSNHRPALGDCTFGHGTAVASTLAGNDTGIGTSPNEGNARGAKLYLQDIGTVGLDTNCNGGNGNADLLNYLPQDYADLFGPPGLVYNDPAAPVRVHSDSWGGTANVYDLQARMVDMFVWAHPDMTIVFAAGNCLSACASGTIGTPGTAKDILTVGGAYNPDVVGQGQNDLAPQSGRGPTSDGRIKPTLVTIFDGDSAMSDGNPVSGAGGPDDHWAGTSYSTPAAAAAAAIVRQYFMEGWYPSGRPLLADAMTPSAALIRAVLIASGVPVTGTGTVSRGGSDTWPNSEQGFGRVLLSNVLPIAGGDTFRTQVVDGTAGLLTGDAPTYTFHIATPGPVKFVLTWSDFPGTLGATKALVNDLDLKVTAPDGTVYRGNHFAPFAQAESLAGGTFDSTNVEEAVIRKTAMVGEWSVQVIGSNVPVGPQPFALVATGSLDGSYGRLTLDRAVYAEADTVQFVVQDSSATSVMVHVASGIEPAGENVTLTGGAPDEFWRGSIRTAFGTPVADGLLQVREGDTITSTYQDLSPVHTTTATAKILASGPTIHDVTVLDTSATSATITWSTIEPSTTEVQFGTSAASLSGNANTSDLVTSHAITLGNLTPDTAYLFQVTSRGRRANATTDTNGGILYHLQTAPLGDVLLVIGGKSFPPEREASYLAALKTNGWTASVWHVADLGLPNLTTLQGRRAVVWQVGLEQYPPFNATERDLVKRYLDGGGRLIVSSHDAAWALSDPNSSFRTPASAAWVRGVLKATFVCDPGSIVRVSGISADPISGAYTGGVVYTPHRLGGADDEIAPISAGGVTSSMWTDDSQVSGCTPSNQPVGLRWVSAARNGTAGIGTWGGNYSRLAYFAFEITSLDTTANDLKAASPTRAAILDAALRWLVSTAPSGLDRDHPDVNITSPSGGVFHGPSLTVDWTAAAYGSGVGIANFTVEASADAGQTWTPIATLAGSLRTYTWNLGTVTNGDRYRLRITAHDDGTPSLSAADVTDATFTIARPNGDTEGPMLWAGSVRVAPLPPGAALPVTFSATADDRTRGGSAIAAAELFLQVAPPPTGATGQGLPMSASDGRFDGEVENVSWQEGLTSGPGTTCAWIHARDAAGNWGPYDSRCFVVINAGPDTVPPAPAFSNAVVPANGNQDLSIGWLAPYDDNLFGGTVEYRVFRADSPRGPWTIDVSGPIPANGSANYRFVDVGRAADTANYYYRIETIDAGGHTTLSSSLAVKFRLSFGTGLNLLGMPLILTDSKFGDFAAGREWADAWAYDGCAGGFGWSSALPTDATTFSLLAGRGFWMNGTAPDVVPALGVVAQTSRLRLCAGWNLIALPGLATGLTVQSLMAGTGAQRVMGFDPAGPYHVRDLNGGDAIVEWTGYWVLVPRDVEWTVPGW
ncbi:MAG: hypothetical protein E6K12_04805 [Methanobacteriota archaeon]|nr:MAG: hypothetical protein E6K12_04805 [Euryarchaeota archaeon]